MFPAHAKNDLKWHEMGPGCFFPTNPDIADILGDTDFDFENFDFWDFLDPRLLDFQVPRFPNFQVPRFPNSQISRFPDFQTPPPAPPPDELSDPNLTPLPMRPGIKYVAKEPGGFQFMKTTFFEIKSVRQLEVSDHKLETSPALPDKLSNEDLAPSYRT